MDSEFKLICVDIPAYTAYVHTEIRRHSCCGQHTVTSISNQRSLDELIWIHEKKENSYMPRATTALTNKSFLFLFKFAKKQPKSSPSLSAVNDPRNYTTIATRFNRVSLSVKLPLVRYLSSMLSKLSFFLSHVEKRYLSCSAQVGTPIRRRNKYSGISYR